MLSTRDPLQIEGHIKTESEEMEKDFSCKWKIFLKSWNSNARMRQNRL